MVHPSWPEGGFTLTHCSEPNRPLSSSLSSTTTCCSFSNVPTTLPLWLNQGLGGEALTVSSPFAMARSDCPIAGVSPAATNPTAATTANVMGLISSARRDHAYSHYPDDLQWCQQMRLLMSLGVFASVPGALTRREQLMSSRGSCIGYKGGRAGREAVQALVRARPSRSLARAVIGV